MAAPDLVAVLPLIVMAATAVLATVAVAIRRHHDRVARLTCAGLVLALGAIVPASSVAPRGVTAALVVDGYGLFYVGLIVLASVAVAILAHGYLDRMPQAPEEFYLLLVLATLGAAVLVVSSHFASFLLGLEILSVSLYTLIAYTSQDRRPLEAGFKYLILAGAASAFLLFGMALIYADLGTLSFAEIGARAPAGAGPGAAYLLTGLGLILAGLGFKLAVVPFHLWTPDVYEGAPAPVAGFVATVSKGAVLALLVRYVASTGADGYPSVRLALGAIAIASMFAGNVLALLQDNVKRLLAYSSIAHLGYLLVALLATGAEARQAVTVYLVAYFITTLGAFGVVTVLSGPDGDADRLDDYRGLAVRRPMVAGVLTGMLLSLAGIPLTAGFIGKFYVLNAGAGAALWALVLVLVVNSGIGLFYYLRVVVALFGPPTVPLAPGTPPAPSLSRSSGVVLAVLSVLLVWFGLYPAPLLAVIRAVTARLA